MWIPRCFRRPEEVLRRELRGIKEVLKDQKSSIDAATESYKSNRRDEPRIVIAPAPTDQEREEAKGQKKKEYTVQKVIAWATSIAAVAGIFYGAIAFWQTWEIRTNFRADQRPWVGIKTLAITGTKNDTGIDASAINYGRTPGLRVEVVSGFYNHPGNYIPGDEDGRWMGMIIQKRISGFFHPIPIANIGTYHSVGNLVVEMQAPPDPTDILEMPDKNMEPPGPNRERQMDITLPNEYSLGVISPNVVYPLEMPQSWSVNGATVIMYGEIRYCDIFGACHETRFCAYRPDWQNPLVFPCPVYNDMK
jgi:hypothetical protein